MGFLLKLVLILIALFLILLVLVQRGRGGGLAASLGGAGGQSAFGAKAGDTFTKITMWSAAIWILLCILVVKVLPAMNTEGDIKGAAVPAKQPAEPGATPAAPVSDTGAEDGHKPDDGDGHEE